ncbi:MAG: hypothetical protein M1835_006525 [Candelina submexicana]|nr:MAG: hypothetical protein M1835_006525 [Candelina submexicana]
MLSRRLARVRPLPRALRPSTPRSAINQIRCLSQAEIEDPDMTGGYINPPREKRQFRDPYADWWDKQERRNYGEPVHEDNDILAVFSHDEYGHYTPAQAFALMGCFIATTLGLCGIVRMLYPDKPSVPRIFPDGLERELGGPNALPVR